jgi:hypothetical protein
MGRQTENACLAAILATILLTPAPAASGEAKIGERHAGDLFAGVPFSIGNAILRMAMG